MTTKASLYFHINNGGVTLAIEDNGDGPVLVLKANHFGHLVGRVSVGIRREDIQEVSDMLHVAAGMTFSPDSCVAASLQSKRGPGVAWMAIRDAMALAKADDQREAPAQNPTAE